MTKTISMTLKRYIGDLYVLRVALHGDCVNEEKEMDFEEMDEFFQDVGRVGDE